MSARKLDKARRRAQIVAAATTLFAEKGFYGATMDDIVAATGLSKGGLYWHFKSKDEIIIAIMESFFSQEMDDLDALVAAGGGVGPRLQALTDHLVGEVVEMFTLFPVSLEFYALATRSETVHAWIMDYFAVYRSTLTRLLAQGVERGELVGDPEGVAITMIALFEGLFLLSALAPEQVDLKSQAHTSMKQLLAGVTPGDS